ncbi:MAG TPA: hypothetical protein VNW94_02975 [Streptosporangiaceae bacterium]|jgi:hypothetical protein|nr:hypothetical protein [Streptosporangiaceae bacterium]
MGNIDLPSYPDLRDAIIRNARRSGYTLDWIAQTSLARTARIVRPTDRLVVLQVQVPLYPQRTPTVTLAAMLALESVFGDDWMEDDDA